MVGWRHGIVSTLVVAGIVMSGLATCMGGELVPETAQMACCKAGHHTCGSDGAPADCCAKTPSPQQQSTIAKIDSLKAPLRAFLFSVTPSIPSIDDVTIVLPSRGLNTSPPIQAPGPPLYIASSSLLI